MGLPPFKSVAKLSFRQRGRYQELAPRALSRVALKLNTDFSLKLK